MPAALITSVGQDRLILPRSGSGDPELQRGAMPSGIRLPAKAGYIIYYYRRWAANCQTQTSFWGCRPNHVPKLGSSSFGDGRRFIILSRFSQIFREFDKKSEKKTGFSEKKVKKRQIDPKSSAKNAYT